MEKIWKILPDAPDSFYEEHPELPRVVAQLLYHRGITTPEKIAEFLEGDYTQHVYDPFLFRDMEKAATRIERALTDNEKITIHGDYDADGVSASSVLTTTLKAMGGTNVNVFLPHRETDGYGLNKKNIQILKDEGTNLIITCDCGVSNREEIALANELGMDVIVTDHHGVPEILPEAYAIIHPGLPNETYPDHGLCGAGVAFKLAQALLRRHKEQGKMLRNDQNHEACEKWLLEYVAIASVADLVPLLGESRTLTKYGLIILNKTRQIGLQKLLLEARLMQEDGSMKRGITTETIGFQIAPRLNAAGRMNHANVAYSLLTTEDPIAATDLAFELEKNNKDRQALVEELVESAEEQAKYKADKPVLCVRGESWPVGVVGLIASKMKEKHYKPTFAFTNSPGELTASGRSIDGFNMVETLQELPHLFARFGGHPMACGFTLAPGVTLEQFEIEMTAAFERKATNIVRVPELKIDAILGLDAIDWELYETLEKFEPFGKDNDRPLYAAFGVEVHAVKPLGKTGSHIHLLVRHGSPRIKKLVGWNFCHKDHETNWCTTLKKGDKIDIAFGVDVNEWNGNRELQMTVRDLRRSKEGVQ